MPEAPAQRDLAYLGAWRAMLYANDRLLSRLGEELMREQDLELSWYEVMLHIWEAGGRVTQRELLERMLLSQSGLSRVLSKMEAAGLVTREAVESDRRNRSVELTEAGRERFRRAAPSHLAGIRKWFGSNLTVRQVETITTGLEKVLAVLEASGPATSDPPSGPK